MSGGAGSQNAGSGGAGVVYTTVDAARAVGAPVALRFDGRSKDFLLDPGGSGQYLGCHPVDQRVALALLVRYGTIKSLPTFGSRFGQIALDQRAEQAAIDEVNRVLADEVRAGNIRIVSIDVVVQRQVTGSLFVAVAYQNLRTSDPQRVLQATTKG